MTARGVEQTCHYFVDEAGDTGIFGKKQRVKIGIPGCSRFFLLGLLHARSPESLNHDLEELRRQILSDNHLCQLPGVQPEDHRTAEQFHAVDDHPIIRRIVYDFIARRTDMSFTCVIRDKREELKYVRLCQARDATYQYKDFNLYDFCAQRLFKQRLHRLDCYEIVFALWNQSKRDRELEVALATARRHYLMQLRRAKLRLVRKNQISIHSELPRGIGGLQVVDYYLWALQRIYERQDDSYFQLIKDRYTLIVDMDDKRKNRYGVYYRKKNPLTLEKVRGRL